MHVHKSVQYWFCANLFALNNKRNKRTPEDSINVR